MTGGPPGGGGQPSPAVTVQTRSTAGAEATQHTTGRGRLIVRLHLRDRGRGIAQLPAAAGTNASGAFT